MSHCSCHSTPCSCQPCCPAPQKISASDLACLNNKINALIKRDDELNERLNVVESLTAAHRTFEPGLFVFTSMQGLGASNGPLAAAMEQEDADAYILGGGNSLTGDGTLDADMAAFDFAIDAGIAYPAYGVQDYSHDDAGADLEAKFSLLFTAERHYYDVEFDKGDVHLFVLDGARDESEVFVGPGGAPSVGSDQYDWFVAKLHASTRRWKIVVIPIPFFGLTQDLPPQTYMDWEFEKMGVHLVLCGDHHQNWHCRRGGMDVIDISCAVLAAFPLEVGLPADITIIENGSPSTYVVWYDDSDGGNSSMGSYAKIHATEQNLAFSVESAVLNTTTHDYTIIR